MTKLEIKHAMWRAQVNLKRRKKLFATMFMLVFAMFALPAIAGVIDNPSDTSAIVASGSSAMCASMALIGSLDDTSDRDASGKQIAYQAYLIAMDQIDKTAAFPKPNANREVGDIPLLPGEVMHYFEAHDIPTDDSKGEKGDFSTAVTNTFVLAMAGQRDALLNFIEEYAGGKFVIIFRECESDNYYILGDLWKPMILKSFERANNKDKRGITFTFENSSFRQIHKYIGSLITAGPITLPAGTATLAIESNNNVYVIPNGTDAAVPVTAVIGLTNNDKGRIITVRGAGTDKKATLEDGDVFILEGGTTWSASNGSSIMLRVVDASRLVEVNGTRVQKA